MPNDKTQNDSINFNIWIWNIIKLKCNLKKIGYIIIDINIYYHGKKWVFNMRVLICSRKIVIKLVIHFTVEDSLKNAFGITKKY